MRRPDLIDGIAREFPRYIERARSAAKLTVVDGIAYPDNIPFSAEIPIFARRAPMPKKRRAQLIDPDTGELLFDRRGRPQIGLVPVLHPDGSPVMIPGARVEAPNLHWIPQRLRDAWLKKLHASDKIENVSASSLLDLKIYNKQADQRYRMEKRDNPRHKRTPAQIRAKKWIERTIRENNLEDVPVMERVFTRMTPLERGLPIELALRDINEQLQRKHSPALQRDGDLASTILLQTKAIPTKNEGKAKKRKVRSAR
jgi:hypothetical protein